MEYILGLDIGIASVGWAVIDTKHGKPYRIVDLGIRIFNKAENPKDGSSLSLPRRLKRNTRRLLKRKAHRMSQVKKLIVDSGLLDKHTLANLFSLSIQDRSPWELRSEGLMRLLGNDEWARVLVHLAKHRGFRSNRKADIGNKASNAGELSQAISMNSQLMIDGGYRTAGEMIWKDPRFLEHKRNQRGDYSHTLSREMVLSEIRILFDKQRKLGNPFAKLELEKAFTEIVTFQLPFAFGDAILKKIGKCTFEKGEPRAPKCSYTAERFMLLNNVNSLQLSESGHRRFLTPEERKLIIQSAYDKEVVLSAVEFAVRSFS